MVVATRAAGPVDAALAGGATDSVANDIAGRAADAVRAALAAGAAGLAANLRFRAAGGRAVARRNAGSVGAADVATGGGADAQGRAASVIDDYAVGAALALAILADLPWVAAGLAAATLLIRRAAGGIVGAAAGRVFGAAVVVGSLSAAARDLGDLAAGLGVLGRVAFLACA